MHDLSESPALNEIAKGGGTVKRSRESVSGLEGVHFATAWP